MRLSVKFIVFFVGIAILSSCNTRKNPPKEKLKKRVRVEVLTSMGKIVLELYNETPKHRDNFIQISKDGVLDSVLFHRVIENFMIQAGDPTSKHALPGDTLGRDDLGYTIDAEINPILFHKKGALAAARDNNPERASSSTQFYIVQGKVYTDSLLTKAENTINQWLADYYTRKDPANKSLVDALQKAKEQMNLEVYTQINDSLKNRAKNYHDFEKYSIPPAHREVYKTIGGTPQLDQNYTVFGEVIKGIEVVDSIAKVPTGKFNRPINDVRILSIRIVE